MNTSDVKYSAQAFIFSPNGEILLEDNEKIKGLSLIGGACKNHESYESCLTRELQEELGEKIATSILQSGRLLNREVQPRRNFGTGKWISCYFTIRLLEEEQKNIPIHTQDKHQNPLNFYSLEDLEKIDAFSLEKNLFLELVTKALRNLGNS